MTRAITIKKQIHFGTERRGRKVLKRHKRPSVETPAASPASRA